MKYKLLALDIDGTLVKPHTNAPTQKVIDSVIKSSEYLHVSLVSARAWEDLQPLIHLLHLEDYYHVIENGTKVIDPQGLVIHDKKLSLSDVNDITQNIVNFSDEIAYCIDGKWLKAVPEGVSSLTSTISVISHSNEKAQKIPHILKQLPNKYHVTVGAHWSEPEWRVSLISHSEASKGIGLSVIQNILKISVSETIAVGDGASDVPTMEYAGLKVAMGNAEPELRSVANYNVRSVEDDGVAQVIEDFILN